MSTVVALGHFCEVHGPRLVFYTIRNINEPQFVSQCPDLKFCSGCKAPLLEGYISTVQTVQSTAPDPAPSPAPRPQHLRDSDSHDEGSPVVTNSHSAPSGFSGSKSLRASSSSQHLSSIASTSTSGGFVSRGTLTNNCTGVSSSSGGGGAAAVAGGSSSANVSSTAPSAGTRYYCSHSNYDHSHLSHLQTCISRTLSCELSPSNSVAFTSSDIWVIGTAFSLKDSQARGFHRRYCLIFTFLPEVPQCCRDPETLDQDSDCGAAGERGGGGASSSSHHHHHHSKGGKPKKGKARIPQQHKPGCSSREDYYSDGDCKGYASYGGYPSLVPYYDYITEEFYNIAKNLQSECDKVYFKEQSISPQRALRLSAFLDGSVPGSSLPAGASLGGHSRSSSKIYTKNSPKYFIMLTCNAAAAAAVAACRYTLIKSVNSSPPSSFLSKYRLLSSRKCVQNLVTRDQKSFLSILSSSSCPSSLEFVDETTHHHNNDHRRLSPRLELPSSTLTKRRRRSRCHLLNLNHHISFNYINSSTAILNTITIHHRCFHRSTAVTAATSGATEGSINRSLQHDIVHNNDYSHKSKPELSTAYEVDEGDDDFGVEEEEMKKERVWSTGPYVTPTFTINAYANESENAKKLIQLGVELSQWEGRYGTITLLYKSDFETQLEPVIRFFLQEGIEGTDLSRVLTVNPYIFNEDVRNLAKRVEYLRLKRFSEETIHNAIVRNPYWLSFSVPRIDRRLGFFQTYFKLTGDQVRKLASAGTSGPKLITYHLGRVKDVTFTIKEEMGFTSEEIVKLLLTRPRIWKEIPNSLRRRFDYLHNEEKFSNADFIRWPTLLLQRERRLKERIGFLKKLGRAQFDPTKPNYISVDDLISGTDADFAVDVAKVGVVEFNNYLKTL